LVDLEKPVIIHILTAGQPKDSSGCDSTQELSSWIIERQFASKSFISFVMLANEYSIVKIYNDLQKKTSCNLSKSYIPSTTSGKVLSKGDYVAKVLVGCYDPSIRDNEKPHVCWCF